jgi:hypothetical protein
MSIPSTVLAPSSTERIRLRDRLHPGVVKRMAFLAARGPSLLAPPVLVLSLPRSGSSWMGETMGRAANAVYLREPFVQTGIARDPRFVVLSYVDPTDPPAHYQRYAKQAFAGVPLFFHSNWDNIVTMPRQWWPLTYQVRRRLVIKEVNPLATGWMLRQYQPRVIFLVRHPAAVALSFRRLGMDDSVSGFGWALHEGSLSPFRNHVLSSASAAPFERLGVLQGAILRYALDVLQTHADCRIVAYEALCADPIEAFRSLFDFSELVWDDEIELFIREQTRRHDNDPYTTFRNSGTMIESWRQEIATDDLRRLRTAFSVFDLPWYRTDAEW